MCKPKRLERIEQAVAERVAELKSEFDTDPGEPAQRSRNGSARSELCKQPRSGPSGVARARQKLAELEQEKAARAKTHATEEANKGEPKVSVSDPEARLMRLADGAVAPAWNVQVATAEGFVVAIDPTDRRKDGGLAPKLVAKVAERCGRAPQRLLADTTAMTREDIVTEDIVTLAQQHPDMTVHSPPASCMVGKESGQSACCGHWHSTCLGLIRCAAALPRGWQWRYWRPHDARHAPSS